MAGGAGFCVGEGVRTKFQDFGKVPRQKTRSQVGREGMWCPSQPSECQRTQPLFRDLGFCRMWQMELRPLALLRGGAHQIPGFWESAGVKAQVAAMAKTESGTRGTHRQLTGEPKAKKKAPTLGAKGPKRHSKQPKTSGRRCGRPRARWRSWSWRRGPR